MAGIFISYRRDDSAAQARAVWERLCRELGREHVFMDVDGIDPGDDFTEVIDRQLEGCQVMLVMMGAKWHNAVDPHGRLRLHNRHDFVRYEVETALRRRIKLVPVLIDNTPPPLEEHLPVELHPLLRRQGLELDFRRHTEAALQRLVEVSRKALVLPDPPSRAAWMHDEGTDQYGRWCEFKVGKVVQRMRWIEPGTFWMGSPTNEAERQDNELRHRVVLTQGYWLADTACTQALWEEIVGANRSEFQGDPQLPVEEVSWSEVTDLFLAKLNARVPGLNLELPTEAQWEYACRAGTTTPFSFGEQITSGQVNYDGSRPYNGGGKGPSLQRTVPVKALSANSWGLHQMHGNVLEWCADTFEPYASEAVQDPVFSMDRPIAALHHMHVLRGGSCFENGSECRSASRHQSWRSERNDIFGSHHAVGFRLARRLEH
ncbi:SUMF1/EgtB/PvdO family nonheme iron enzyme [uncultured Sphaerotilus sp.]|uniref:SUMF1/EgtB/PvdO family nonheme iron enzyme n=1 Tax=uncultured Sphaerotilus sp. TaxID=474984 RepID=UPI0030CA1501